MNYSLDVQRKHVEDFINSQMGKGEYEHRHGLHSGTFRRWLRKHRPDFVAQIGRPRKYGYLLDHLGFWELYSYNAIFLINEELGLISAETPKELKEKKMRIRIALARYSEYHLFPKQGDGHLPMERQAHTFAWYGWRWQGKRPTDPDAPLPPLYIKWPPRPSLS